MSAFSKGQQGTWIPEKTLWIRVTKWNERAFETSFRPTLEYACKVWDPHTKRTINMVKNVQYMSAEFVHHNYHSRSSVTAMLECLGWPTLHDC